MFLLGSFDIVPKTMKERKKSNKTDIVQLLEQYQNDPKETQKTTRNKLNLKGKKNKI